MNKILNTNTIVPVNFSDASLNIQRYQEFQDKYLFNISAIYDYFFLQQPYFQKSYDKQAVMRIIQRATLGVAKTYLITVFFPLNMQHLV